MLVSSFFGVIGVVGVLVVGGWKRLAWLVVWGSLWVVCSVGGVWSSFVVLSRCVGGCVYVSRASRVNCILLGSLRWCLCSDPSLLWTPRAIVLVCVSRSERGGEYTWSCVSSFDVVEQYALLDVVVGCGVVASHVVLGVLPGVLSILYDVNAWFDGRTGVSLVCLWLFWELWCLGVRSWVLLISGTASSKG